MVNAASVPSRPFPEESLQGSKRLGITASNDAHPKERMVLETNAAGTAGLPMTW
jgi:hypothetical protein